MNENEDNNINKKPRFILPEFLNEEVEVKHNIINETPKEVEKQEPETLPVEETFTAVVEPITETAKVEETPVYSTNIISEEEIIREKQEEIVAIPELEEQPVKVEEPVLINEPIPENKPTINLEEQKRIERELTKKEEKSDEDEYSFYQIKDLEVQPYRSRKISFDPSTLNDEVDYKKETDLIGVPPVEKDPNLFPSIKPIVEPVSSPTIVEHIDDLNPEIPQEINIINQDDLVEQVEEIEIPTVIEELEEEKEDKYSFEDLDANTDIEITKEDLVKTLREKSEIEHTETIIGKYGEDYTAKDYVTNPAIGRSEEIKQLILILLTPEKSAILTGKPGIGKTSIVEGLSYAIQRNNVPDALKGYTIVNVKTPSLLGSLPSGETRLQTLVDELKKLDKVILFIDEIHMLIGSNNNSALDFANMFKEGLGRGAIKVIGATTTEEYERYVLRDKAFVRRFQKIEIFEPSKEETVKIMMGTLPKIEKNTGAKLKYTHFMQSEIMSFIVDITSEFKRIYGVGSRYPDICITLLAQAYSQAVFDDRHEVTILDVRDAIENSKNIYPDVIKKELINFDTKFTDLINEEKGVNV